MGILQCSVFWRSGEAGSGTLGTAVGAGVSPPGDHVSKNDFQMMYKLTYLGKILPLVLDLRGLVIPLVSYNLRDIWICNTGVLSKNA